MRIKPDSKSVRPKSRDEAKHHDITHEVCCGQLLCYRSGRLLLKILKPQARHPAVQQEI